MPAYCVQEPATSHGRLRFPFTPHALLRLLKASGLTKIYCVNYSRGRPGAPLVRARYRGMQRQGWAMAGSVTITVYAIPATQFRAVHDDLTHRALPQLLHWLTTLEQGDDSQRLTDHSWQAALENHRLRISHD